LTETIDTAKAPGVFSLDKFLSDTAYPEEDVTLFTNAHAVNELIKLRVDYRELEDKLAAANKNKRDKNRTERTVGGETFGDSQLREAMEDKLKALQEQIDVLDDEVAQSALTFKLRGMPPEIVEEVTNKHFVDPTKDYTGTPEEQERDFELIARSVVNVTNANGGVDSHAFAADDIKKIKGRVLGGEYLRLVQMVAHVNLNGALFDQAVDASFLGRRAHLAWESELRNIDQGS
jgi:hypothetical protein